MVIDVLKEVDMNKNGMLTMEELLHLVRRLFDFQTITLRQREHQLLERSGMELERIEDWHTIFLEMCADAGPYSIKISDIKDKFSCIGLKWDKEGTKQMKEWLTEVDEDYNGQID